jgi:Dna[CI] antecedent, DciA
MQHARATLRKIFTDTLRREGDNAPVLAWPLACGARTAERTTALTFANGVLTVVVPDKRWQSELQRLGPQYLAALNQISSQPVARIEFVPADRSSH